MISKNYAALRGDTTPELPFRILVNGVPLDLTSATLLCQFRATPKSPAALTLTETAGMTITNPTNGQLKINEQIYSIAAGIYAYDIEMTLGNGLVKTYIGGNLQVIETTSRKT
jgi:hypothetical protein